MISSAITQIVPQSILAISIHTLQLIYAFLYVIIFLTIFFTVNQPRYKEDLSEVINAFEYQTKQTERDFNIKFRMNLEEAITELKNAESSIISFLKYIDPDN